MKFLKWILVILGTAAIITAIVLLVKNLYAVQILNETVRTYNNPKPSPIASIAIMSGLLLLGGLLAGIAIGMPGRLRSEKKTSTPTQQAMPAGYPVDGQNG